MGKLPNSPLHDMFSMFLGVDPASKVDDKFSDWHVQRCASHAAMIDLDVVFVRVKDKVETLQRLWTSLNPKTGFVTAILDIKNPKDNVTSAELMAYKRFENVGFPCYIAYWHRPEQLFHIIRLKTGLQTWLTEQEFVLWRNLHSPYTFLVDRALNENIKIKPTNQHAKKEMKNK